ncbi:MAG: tRNA lysidine(34) synthetase TilS [Rhizobiales bacterium]|nr:tRNA lysidine(34) synthetase TilS [Hyphomicrobiales bacterium]
MPIARADLFNPISGLAHVALAVSGGSDSLGLAHLARRGFAGRLTALTVDHGLRPESAAEARQVAGWMAGLGIDHEILRWQGPKPQTGIQARARAARYDLMANWCAAHGVSHLLTAHTLDDQAETVLMRLARTTSLDSLAGIPRLGRWQGIVLFRPLLAVRREAIRAMLGAAGQQWIDDPSNADRRFERVRIRQALPGLAAIGVTAEALAELAGTAAAAAEALQRAADDWVGQHVRHHDTGFCIVPRPALAAQGEELHRRVLARLIARYGAGERPEPSELDRLNHWLAGPLGGRRTLGGAIIALRHDHLLIGREAGRIDPTPVAVPVGGEVVWDRRYRIKAEAAALVRPAGMVAGLARRKDLPAFVQNSLPAVTTPDGEIAVPHLGLGRGVAVAFCGGAG